MVEAEKVSLAASRGTVSNAIRSARSTTPISIPLTDQRIVGKNHGALIGTVTNMFFTVTPDSTTSQTATMQCSGNVTSASGATFIPMPFQITLTPPAGGGSIVDWTVKSLGINCGDKNRPWSEQKSVPISTYDNLINGASWQVTPGDPVDSHGC